LLTSQQVLRGGQQVILLTVELAHAHVQICRSPEHLPALHRQLQSPLISAHCLAEPALCNPYVGQRHGSTDGIGQVTYALHSRHALGIHTVRCLKISSRPGCESQERRSGSADESVVYWQEFERLSGIGYGAGYVSRDLGNGGTIQSYCA